MSRSRRRVDFTPWVSDNEANERIVSIRDKREPIVLRDLNSTNLFKEEDLDCHETSSGSTSLDVTGMELEKRKFCTVGCNL